MKIATWNVNSIRARLLNVLDWIDDFSPDVLLLQELKVVEEGFPFTEFEDKGYNIAVSGQKSWNGVALLSKYSIEDVRKHLVPSDPQARYIEAVIDGRVRMASLYAPNGNPIGTEKFTYKLSWMDHLKQHVKNVLENKELFILGGDYNVAPTSQDLYDEKAFKDDAIVQPESREKFAALMDLGLIDIFRKLYPNQEKSYTYWGYRGFSWQKDHGILLDFLLASPLVEKHLKQAGIDKAPRGKEKASDHTPLWCELDL